MRGEPRSAPVSIATVDRHRYLIAAFAEADWVHNVRAAGAGTVSRARSAEGVRLTEVPVNARDPMLLAFLEQVRGGVRFLGTADPDEVAAAAARYPVFERLSP